MVAVACSALSSSPQVGVSGVLTTFSGPEI